MSIETKPSAGPLRAAEAVAEYLLNPDQQEKWAADIAQIIDRETGDGKLAADLCQASQQLTDAWTIIQTLHAERMDAGESWPRALDWLARNEGVRPPKR